MDREEDEGEDKVAESAAYVEDDICDDIVRDQQWNEASSNSPRIGTYGLMSGRRMCR